MRRLALPDLAWAERAITGLEACLDPLRRMQAVWTSHPPVLTIMLMFLADVVLAGPMNQGGTERVSCTMSTPMGVIDVGLSASADQLVKHAGGTLNSGECHSWTTNLDAQCRGDSR